LNSEIEYTASEVSTYATCIEIPDTESDEEPADVDNLHETTSSKDSQIERPHDVSFDWETEDKRSKQHTCDPGLVGRFYHVPDNDCIAIPPRSPVYEILRDERSRTDPQERVHQWLYEQFRNIAPKEHWQRHFLFEDNGRYYNGTYHFGDRITNFLDSQNGPIGDVARTKLERIMINFFPLRWGSFTIKYWRYRDRLYVHNEAWDGWISLQWKHIMNWKPSLVARHLWRKIFLAAHKRPVPEMILGMIEKISKYSDYTDNYLSNAEFILNSKVGLIEGGYFNPDGSTFEYCYQERFSTSRKGDFVEIIDNAKKKYMFLQYKLLQIPDFNLVNWWFLNEKRERQRKYIIVDPYRLSDTWECLWNGISSASDDESFDFEYSDDDSLEEDLAVMSVIESFGQQINGHPARALVDSGSLSDFISSALVQQLELPKVELVKPLQVQMAVQGSRSKVNYGTTVSMTYQGIKGKRYFDVMNLSNYDLILGTPFLYQHRDHGFACSSRVQQKYTKRTYTKSEKNSFVTQVSYAKTRWILHYHRSEQSTTTYP
ncbi:hypothetical protein AGABI1DRAFT_95849, partial [Agaricus bisporus var. burnettii JB137-S8]